jgi:hypothetical protein
MSDEEWMKSVFETGEVKGAKSIARFLPMKEDRLRVAVKKCQRFGRVITQNETGRYRAVPDDLLDLLPDVALRKAGGTARVLNARKRKHDPSGRFARN